MRIIIDEFNLQSYSEALLVTDDKSFIEARKQVLDFKIDQQNNNLIVVTSHPYSVWFFDIENESQISIERVLPSKKLKEKFKIVELDKDLDEKDIVHLDLINQAIEPTEISIINHYIGSFLLSGSDLKEQLFKITEYAANPHKKFKESKYLLKKWSKYLDKIEIDSPVIQKLISKLKDLDAKFCKVINELIYVSNSKTLLREWMHDSRASIESKLQLPANDLERLLAESQIQVPFNEQYEAKIEKFFKTLYKEDINEFFREKSNYKASLKAFLKIAKTINNEEKEVIFTNYRKSIDIELEEKIRSLIKPELTAPPVIKDMALALQVEEWHRWAEEIFIPFKFYLDEFPNETDTKLVEEYADVYSDWLFESYKNIVQSGIKTNYNITGIISNVLDDSRVVWLIIDGFPNIYKETLISILKANGINKIQTDTHFAAIPTITKVGIPTQLSGRFPQSKGYSNDKVDALKLAFNSKNVIYRNSIKTFAEALESDFDICCLHWHEIDEFMHKDDKDIDTRRIEEIRRLIGIRIKQIANIIKANTDKKIKLIVSTDHGCTKCLTRDQSIKNSSLIEACKDNPKERCIEITGSLAKQHFDNNEIYYLRTEHTLNLNNWAVAKGYRYFGRFDYGYRHGGLTPEETIVPFLICEIAQNELLPLKIFYGGLADIQLGYTETLKLTITNDNDSVVEINKILVLEDKNFDIDKNLQLQSLSSKTITGKIKLSKSIFVKDGKAKINVQVNYSLFGEKHSDAIIIIVPIKRSINESLDNLFS